MISISTITQNASGSIVLNEAANSALMSNTARISRTATLDGGCVVTHSGYSDGDRTLSISGRITEDQASVLWAFFQEETFVIISIPDGLFFAAIQRLSTDNGELSMTILIKNSEV